LSFDIYQVAIWEPETETRITVSFLFVLFRVIWWIACYAPRKAIQAHHTK